MGRYDFSCNVGCQCVSYDNDKDVLRITCYWKNNGWRYHMQPVYGWVTCNGEERCVYNAGYPDFQSDNQAQYALGSSDYTIWRGHSTINSSYSARLRSDSSYASGERWSSSGSYATGAKPSYGVSYNANGGTGAPGGQTKWWNETLTLSSSKPSRTGYNFNSWNTASNGSGSKYNPGQNYTANSGLTLYAVWNEITYTVSYNANGGSGAPGNQTKRYTTNLTLSSTKPTRAGYNFKGWATSATGGVVYAPGATYKNNSAITLYAVWEVAYKKPTITGLTAIRCNNAGTASDTGTYIKLYFKFGTFNAVQKIGFQYKPSTSTSWTTIDIKSLATIASGNKSGTIDNKVTGNGAISAGASYDVRVYVSDDANTAADKTTYSAPISISSQKFPIDVKKGGKGIAFNKVAERDNAFDIGFNEIWLGGIKIIWYS